MSETELKPCPFDGSAARQSGGSLVGCSHEYCPLYHFVMSEESWNRRPQGQLDRLSTLTSENAALRERAEKAEAGKRGWDELFAVQDLLRSAESRVAELEKLKTHTHEISACYYPVRKEIDLYWTDLSTGNRAFLTVKVSKKDGKAISETVMPCVYQGAIVVPPATEAQPGKPKFGEWMRGIYASESNPHRDGMYVKTVTRIGTMNTGKFYELTDGRGDFWEMPVASAISIPSPAPAATEARREAMPEAVSIDAAIERLNEMLAADPRAIQALIDERVSCSEALANHKTCQVGRTGKGFEVGPLGIINGILGADTNSCGFVAAEYGMGVELIKFVRYAPPPATEGESDE